MPKWMAFSAPASPQNAPDRTKLIHFMTSRLYPDWCQADRHAGLRLAALHLHRVRADVLSTGGRALPFRSNGGSGDIRDDLVVHSVSNLGAYHGEVPAAATCASRRRRRAAALAQPAGPVPAHLRGGIRAVPRW